MSPPPVRRTARALAFFALGERDQREHPVLGGDQHVVAFGHAEQQRVRLRVLDGVAVRVRDGHLVAAQRGPEGLVRRQALMIRSRIRSPLRARKTEGAFGRRPLTR